MKTRPQQLVVCAALGALSIVTVSLAPRAALAAPPATVATCDGIKSAYPVLGAQCANSYAKISHAPNTAAKRLTTYKARVAVVQIFQKAMLCNGMYGANQSAQQAFSQGEEGHLQAISNLHNAMMAAGDPGIPALYTEDDLKTITMKKQQCK
ncbi:MAG: hypothetical protein M3N49_09900 [Candidatus Eremiobacteraeota bacterium]|nr:hypothetical protein [Candidatus Eremiobacteraeota bacterium]